MRQLVIVGMVMLSLFGMTAQKMTKAERKAKIAEQVNKNINSNSFRIDVNQALPMSAQMITLTSTYYLEIKGDTIISELPYFGRAYTAPMNLSGGGLSFKEVAKSIKKTNNGKKGWMIDVEVKAPEDYYRYSIVVFSNGESAVNLTSNNRSFISYRGTMAKIE